MFVVEVGWITEIAVDYVALWRVPIHYGQEIVLELDNFFGYEEAEVVHGQGLTLHLSVQVVSIQVCYESSGFHEITVFYEGIVRFRVSVRNGRDPPRMLFSIIGHL